MLDDISLPLMGIRNPCASARAERRRGTHYPSWGSGTQLPVVRRTRKKNSLPLMGIRNRKDGRHRRHRLELITPHGDQEPGGVDPRVRLDHPLITPHGDQEPEPGHRPLRNGHLITPHGDQEHVSSASARTSPHSAHYPSWGSGTQILAGVVSDHHLSLPLMGIRNVRPIQFKHVMTTAHYPSWGSGTGDFRESPDWPIAAHYPSWGSGTEQRFPHGMGRS